MKTILLCCLISLTPFLSANAKETLFKYTVRDYDKLEKNIFIDNSVSIEFYNALAVSERTSAKLTTKGTYTLKADMTYPQVVLIQSGSGYFTEILVSPGDTVSLLITYNITSVKTQGYPSPHYVPDFKSAFLGKKARIHNTFFDFRDHLNMLSISIAKGKDLSDVDTLNSMLALLPKAVATFFRENKQYNTGLDEFAIHEISYKLIQNAMASMEGRGKISEFSRINFPRIQYLSNPVVQSILSSRSLPEETVKIIMSRCYFNNPQLSISEEEQILIRKGWKEKLSSSDSLKVRAIGSQFKTNPAAIVAADSIKFNMETDYYFQNLPLDIAEFLTAKDIHARKIDQNANYYRDIASRKIKSADIKHFLAKESAATGKNKSVSYIDNKSSNIIKTLLKAFPGKNMYIDVWATWCSPCIGEFKYYPRLVDNFKDNVVFIMLCVDSQEPTYQNMIGKLPFKAHHYLLSDLQYRELKNEFGITGIPHYLFINKSGEILNKYKRPSDHEGLFDDIKTQL